MANCDFSAVDNIGENRGLANLSPPAEKENPDACAKANGADQLGISFKTEEYFNRAKSATALCYAIADCDPADACILMEAALDGLRAGMPIAPFLSLMNEASFWADMATRNELKAYSLACYSRMPAHDKTEFLAHIGGLK